MMKTGHAPPEPVSVLHELDLGRHTLLLMSDGSLDLLAHTDEQSTYLADNGLQLDHEETYRLFTCLREHFQPTQPQKDQPVVVRRQAGSGEPPPLPSLLSA